MGGYARAIAIALIVTATSCSASAPPASVTQAPPSPTSSPQLPAQALPATPSPTPSPTKPPAPTASLRFVRSVPNDGRYQGSQLNVTGYEYGLGILVDGPLQFDSSGVCGGQCSALREQGTETSIVLFVPPNVSSGGYTFTVSLPDGTKLTGSLTVGQAARPTAAPSATTAALAPALHLVRTVPNDPRYPGSLTNVTGYEYGLGVLINGPLQVDSSLLCGQQCSALRFDTSETLVVLFVPPTATAGTYLFTVTLPDATRLSSMATIGVGSAATSSPRPTTTPATGGLVVKVCSGLCLANTGIPGVAVTLTGNSVNLRIVTDAQGTAIFDPLTPGSGYTITLSCGSIPGAPGGGRQLAVFPVPSGTRAGFNIDNVVGCP